MQTSVRTLTTINDVCCSTALISSFATVVTDKRVRFYLTYISARSFIRNSGDCGLVGLMRGSSCMIPISVDIATIPC